MISLYKRTKNFVYDRHADKLWYSIGRKVITKFIRPSIHRLQSLISFIFSKFGVVLVWEMFAAVSNFHENRYLVLRGFDGVTFLGKSIYISRKNIRIGYREYASVNESIANIVDTTGKNLTPITFIEASIVRDGTFKIQKKFRLRSAMRTHLIGEGSPPILLPDGYTHFGHFVPQLLPFIIRESTHCFALNLSNPDDINRNI